MKSEVVETRTSKVWLDEDGIFRTLSLPDVNVTLEDFKAINRQHRRLCGGKKTPILNDIRGAKTMVSREARIFAASEEACEITSAAALLVGSPVSRVIGNFFLGINRPPYPTRLFTSEAEAIKWLKGFLEN